MTYEMYRYVFLGGAAASALLLIIAVTLFFTMHIPKVISDVTGRTARKAIENIRKNNEASGEKSYQTSAVNSERGKLTDKISPSGRLIPNQNRPHGTEFFTEKISTQPLGPDETTVLAAGNETTVLNDEGGQTTLLDAPQQAFSIEYEITFTHSDEVIE